MPAHRVFPMMLIRTAGLPLAALETMAASWQTAEEALLVGQKRLTDSSQALQQAWDSALAALPDAPLRTAVYNARKAFFQHQKLPAAAVIAAWDTDDARPEIVSLLQALEHFAQQKNRLDTAQTAYHQHYTEILEAGYQTLQSLAGHESLRRALLFASHALLEQLDRFAQVPVEQFAKKERQIGLATLQYLTRMAVKTSPLSRLTTVSMPAIRQAVADTDSDVEHHHLSKAVVTPNVAFLEVIYDVLLREPVFFRSLQVRLNPCITDSGLDSFEWLFFNGTEESFQRTAGNPVLVHIAQLLTARRRQMPFSELLGALEAEVEASPVQLEQFVRDLLDSGFLEWVLPETGLSPGWCGALYQYLGFLPAEPVIVETAALLQWLRTSARTLPYQTPEDTLSALRDTRQQLQDYFEKYGVAVPPIPAEQVFFEDVEVPVALPIPAENLTGLIDQLADCWRNGRAEKPLPAERARARCFLEKTTASGQSLDFLAFARSFLEQRLQQSDPLVPDSTARSSADDGPRRIGALLQVYREKGRWYAVVNGLFPGGGKLFARWMHLFGPAARTAFEQWTAPEMELETAIAFPWQGWNNANFQPLRNGSCQLDVPGGRIPLHSKSAPILLGNLDIRNDETGPLLLDRVSGRVFRLDDLGLEAPESRPPVMRLLWQLGVPYVSLDALLPPDLWQPLYDATIRYRARLVYRDLVLARAAWAIDTVVWTTWLAVSAGVDFFAETRKALSGMGVPQRFFAYFPGEKPQYYDQNSPVCMVLFQKNLQRGAGVLYCTEMLPLPERDRPDWRATEIVVEFEL